MSQSINEFFALNFAAYGADLARTPVYATEQKILGFAQFHSGWCYGRGQAFSREVIRIAKSLNRKAIAAGFIETDAFPGPEGEVRVTIYREPDYLEFTVNPDLTVNFVRENKDREFEPFPLLTAQNAEIEIERFSRELWTSHPGIIPNVGGSWISSVSSLGIGTIGPRNDSKTGLLRTQATEAEYLSLTHPV